jgi:predicted RNA-binding Zn-ribbon protein involved in translation (DUF1610 family)
MPNVLYHCPNTGFRVQGYTDEQISADQDANIPVTCLACKFVHFVIPKTGEVVASRDPPADGN